MPPIKIYKFGGASVRSAEGVENLARIVAAEPARLLVIVSAMGKTTNALEEVLDRFMRNRSDKAIERFAEIERYHRQIVRSLFADPSSVEARTEKLASEVRELLRSETCREDYDRWYDRIVSYGELLSTVIVSEYLAAQGTPNRWLDMRGLFVTDSRYREATINVDRSARALRRAVDAAPERVLVGQGFIGATPAGRPTTLGREGSDYSAAMAGYLLDAGSVTIWKDVDGILSADPRLFADTMLIPELSYLDAIELAYAGAQVIHPKTIKPLQNKNIPLYVRPFGDPTKPGSVICASPPVPPGVPVRILKGRQVLISIRPKDFSFVLEERLADIFFGIRPIPTENQPDPELGRQSEPVRRRFALFGASRRCAPNRIPRRVQPRHGIADDSGLRSDNL
ncbi:MAG: aspartate kinase [Alistipes ihumii]|uniref:aspartate kinase n=1 Tax=Alistipes ihumii TaxID=1470347 RepID=UPI00399BACCB